MLKSFDLLVNHGTIHQPLYCLIIEFPLMILFLKAIVPIVHNIIINAKRKR